ncbi:MAG: iron complex transport system ATP-binding protein [Actinomycetota bacterium]|nr:iron complex transport system ATP-binding protein [Actinomycetota bacterium]
MTDNLAVARDLELSYGSHVALRASSFEIPLVGATAVIGPNGSGKSTLLSALAGLVPATGGTLTVLGRDPAAVRNRISYVLQATPVSVGVPITVREAVMMGRYPRVGLFRRFSKADHAAVDGAMAHMAITDLADRHLYELSGGQRQRVLVAQGIAQEHEVLLLDEPLTGLDITSARTIDDLIHGQRADGCSVVLTTHDLDEARAADWVVLVSGQVIAYGPADQVCTRRNLEVAFGLGSLHDWDGFLNDPHEP